MLTTTDEKVSAVDDHPFFTGMSLTALAVVFVGFAASYFLWPVIRSTYDGADVDRHERPMARLCRLAGWMSDYHLARRFSGGSMARLIALLVSLGLVSSSALSSQDEPPRPPVIDMHAHLTAENGPRIMDALNIRYVLLAGDREGFAKMRTMANRYLPALAFPCPDGRQPLFGRFTCYVTGTEFPDLAWVRREVQAGRIKAFGEVMPQALGIAPGHSRMQPYWALAEELDLPVGIHMGPGPPGVAYESSPVPMKHPDFGMAQGDPMLLEDVLLRHKRLRLWVMHAGWPRLESMMALLYAHPGVYVDTGGLQSDRIVPRAGYYRYLQALVENGFGKRILFGSDFPDQIEMGIEAITAAPFLTPEQKSDILCNNAARFLRLGAAICQP